jgi:hypothetical protein
MGDEHDMRKRHQASALCLGVLRSRSAAGENEARSDLPAPERPAPLGGGGRDTAAKIEVEIEEHWKKGK